MTKIQHDILALRSAKNSVDPWRAYGQFFEDELGPTGRVESFATLLLTNRECSFRCTMCDLWKNTIDSATPLGAIPLQIERSLKQLPVTENIKLYNSGNFFDLQAIPATDHGAIAQLLTRFKRVVVENHPKLSDRRCIDFSNLISAQLEIALGLETIHPETLRQLNKQMKLDDFDRAVDYLRSHQIDVRAFILIKPPGLDEAAGIEWAVRSVAHALQAGAQCCTLIPVRSGNGYVDRLISDGIYSEPSMRSIETAFDQALACKQGGRVFLDLWDIERFSDCHSCNQQRIARLQQMNLTQQILPTISCEQC